jgi:hypothetical protein
MVRTLENFEISGRYIPLMTLEKVMRDEMRWKEGIGSAHDREYNSSLIAWSFERLLRNSREEPRHLS